MPRINQLQDQYAREDLLCEIRKCQGINGLMNCRSLSAACGIPYQVLLRRLQHPENFTLGEIKSLIKAVHLSPYVLLSFVGYAKKDMKNIVDGG